MFPKSAEWPKPGGENSCNPALRRTWNRLQPSSAQLRLLRAAVVLVNAACAEALPTLSDAQGAIAATVDSGSAARLLLHSVEKRDGVNAEVDGVKQYHLEFTAGALAHQGLMAAITSTGIATRRLEYADTARNFNWGGWFSRQVQGQIHLSPYDRVTLEGTVQFALKESGWRVTGVRYAARVDTTMRSTPPESLPHSQFLPLLGEWYDGGPDCAAIEPRHWATNIIVLKYWYCEVGQENAAERDVGLYGELIRDAQDQVRVRSISQDSISIQLRQALTDRLGNTYGPTQQPIVFESMSLVFDKAAVRRF